MPNITAGVIEELYSKSAMRPLWKNKQTQINVSDPASESITVVSFKTLNYILSL